MSKQTISRESSKAWNPQTTGWVWTQKTKQQGTCALETRADRINDHWNFWPRGDRRSCLFLALAWGLEEDFEKGRRLQEKQLWAVHHHNVGHLSHWSWWFSVGTMMLSAALSKYISLPGGVTSWLPGGICLRVSKASWISLLHQLMWTRRQVSMKVTEGINGAAKVTMASVRIPGDTRGELYQCQSVRHCSVWLAAWSQTTRKVSSLLGSGNLGQIR